tara:strand:+ start:396 stop:818 length:423 start_codon:yes stop_codon:yes gene_type:complete
MIKINKIIEKTKKDLTKHIKEILILALIILLVDALFLKIISRTFGKMIQNIQGSEMKIRWNYAMFVYALIVVQIYFLLIKHKRPLSDAFLLGATTYGIFDFTSMAILKNYKLNIALIDMFWGGTLYYIVLILFRKITTFF